MICSNWHTVQYNYGLPGLRTVLILMTIYGVQLRLPMGYALYKLPSWTLIYSQHLPTFIDDPQLSK